MVELNTMAVESEFIVSFTEYSMDHLTTNWKSAISVITRVASILHIYSPEPAVITCSILLRKVGIDKLVKRIVPEDMNSLSRIHLCRKTGMGAWAEGVGNARNY